MSACAIVHAFHINHHRRQTSESQNRKSPSTKCPCWRIHSNESEINLMKIAHQSNLHRTGFWIWNSMHLRWRCFRRCCNANCKFSDIVDLYFICISEKHSLLKHHTHTHTLLWWQLDWYSHTMKFTYNIQHSRCR